MKLKQNQQKILKVIHSCVNEEQVKVAMKWIERLAAEELSQEVATYLQWYNRLCLFKYAQLKGSGRAFPIGFNDESRDF